MIDGLTASVRAPAVDGAGIEARGVRRSFGDVEAVRGIDLTARRGEVTGLVGPNGAGKTTLLLVLATLLVPDAGDVRVAGFDPVTHPREVRARMGWAPDVFGLYDGLTAREYLELFAAAYRLPAAARSDRAMELLALVHLSEFAQRPVHVLSRGQKQRLGLARALVHRPAVLLLDEPASGLDPRSRVDLRDLLRLLAAEGAAVVISSHALSELEEVADRVVFVQGGITVGEHLMGDLPSDTRRPWHLRALDLPGLASWLTAHAVAHSPVGPAGIEISLAGDSDAADLVTALVRDGVRLTGLAPAGGLLEAAYLNLTKERT